MTILRLARPAALLGLALALSGSACRMDEPDAAPPPSDPPPPVVEAAPPAPQAPAAERVAIGDVWWYVDYDAALTVAKEQDKALWVHFGENPG